MSHFWSHYSGAIKRRPPTPRKRNALPTRNVPLAFAGGSVSRAELIISIWCLVSISSAREQESRVPTQACMQRMSMPLVVTPLASWLLPNGSWKSFTRISGILFGSTSCGWRECYRPAFTRGRIHPAQRFQESVRRQPCLNPHEFAGLGSGPSCLRTRPPNPFPVDTRSGSQRRGILAARRRLEAWNASTPAPPAA